MTEQKSEAQFDLKKTEKACEASAVKSGKDAFAEQKDGF